jgi:hypothetical protein
MKWLSLLLMLYPSNDGRCVYVQTPNMVFDDEKSCREFGKRIAVQEKYGDCAVNINVCVRRGG